jgi:hypothetical protein
MAMTCSTDGAKRSTYVVLVGNPERKKSPLGRPRRKWEFHVKMDLRQIRWGYGLD